MSPNYYIGVIHIVRTHEGGGGGGREKAYVCVRGGRWVLLGQVRTHAKKIFALFQVFERPQISDITQKHNKNNTFHNEYFLL